MATATVTTAEGARNELMLTEKSRQLTSFTFAYQLGVLRTSDTRCISVNELQDTCTASPMC